MGDYSNLVVSVIGLIQPFLLFYLGLLHKQLSELNKALIKVQLEYTPKTDHSRLHERVHDIAGIVQTLDTVEKLRRAGALRNGERSDDQ